MTAERCTRRHTRSYGDWSSDVCSSDLIPPLVRLEARVVVLGDARYATAWTERAARVADDLERLAEFPLNQSEAVHFNAARAAFEGYRRIVEIGRASCSE